MDLTMAFGPLLVLFLIFGPIIVYELTASPRADDRRQERRRQDRAAETKKHTGACGCSCGVCGRPVVGEHASWFKQHECPGFGRLTCCGYEVMTTGGQDAFTHFCPPTIARERLAVEREMDRQRQGYV